MKYMRDKIKKLTLELNNKLKCVNPNLKINAFYRKKENKEGFWVSLRIDGIEKPGDWRYKQILKNEIYKEINDLFNEFSTYSEQPLSSNNEWFISKSKYKLEYDRARTLAQDYFTAKSWNELKGLDWKEREIRCAKLENIPHNCNFKNGKCRGLTETAWTKSKMCCCNICPNEYGYIKSVKPEALDFIKENFDPKLGFWREGAGCILPWKWRSNTCISFTCRKDYKEISKRIQEYLDGKTNNLDIRSNEE